MSPDSRQHITRRLILPSGRMIEVVRLPDAEPTGRLLHVCPECASELVQPLSWAPAAQEPPAQGQWELALRCPNCFWFAEGVYDEADVSALEDALDHGLEQLLSDLLSLAEANLNDEVERFAAALHAGHILPEDF